MFKATVIEVFIASPSDIIQERNYCREIIEEWNIINSKKQQKVLKPLGWEKNVYSSLKGQEAQSIINKQILENADILVGIFWTRIGTPTKDFESGTIEEIKKHMGKNKPVMIFFSDAPVIPSSIDSEQYEKLIEFKNWCKANGIINTFDSAENFINKFRNQLGIMMNDDLGNLKFSGTGIDDDLSLEIHKTIPVPISRDAQKLIKEISLDASGQLTVIMTLGGYLIQTNGTDYSPDIHDARGTANINAVIEELERYDLIRATNHERNLFNITAKGYEFADKLE